MSRKTPTPVVGRPLTAFFRDEDLDMEAIVIDHIASEPWHRVERALNHGTRDKDDITEFTAILSLAPTLSAFLVQAATDLDVGEGATRSYCDSLTTGRDADDLYRDVLMGERARPVLKRLRRAQRIAHQAMKVDMTSSGPDTAGAWLCWAMGAPSTAKRYAMRALKLNPQHRFAADNAPFMRFLAGDILNLAEVDSRPSWPRPR